MKCITLHGCPVYQSYIPLTSAFHSKHALGCPLIVIFMNGGELNEFLQGNQLSDNRLVNYQIHTFGVVLLCLMVLSQHVTDKLLTGNSRK
jgi:hypothetical protein